MSIQSRPIKFKTAAASSQERCKVGNPTNLTPNGDFDLDGLADTAECNLSLGA